MSEWISVEERLPKEYVQSVLVARHDGCLVPCVMAAYYTEEGFVTCTIAGNNLMKEPTHWRPFPPPPPEKDQC